MTTSELLATALANGIPALQTHLADFQDADLLVRPAPAANHAAWQLGHLVSAEPHLVGLVCPDVKYDLPAGWAQKFSKDTAKLDDPAAFPGKDELLRQFAAVRNTTVQWVRGLTDADLAKPGPERLRAKAPTWGMLLILMSNHVSTHIGQIQVIRRKLGKPVLF